MSGQDREVHISLDRDSLLDAWRLSIECDDEVTTMFMIGAASEQLVPTREALRGAYGQMLVEDHQARCASCRSWAAS